jgi:hypothetical protein
MKIAKTANGQVTEVGYYKDLFPGTSFATTGPNDSFMQESACLPVVNPSCDMATQKLVPITPVIVGDHVETYALQALTTAEKTPASVTPRQLRQALTAAGLRATVEAAVAGGSQDLKDWWEFSLQIERNHPEVVAMGTALGQTEDQMNQLFIAAGAL